MAKSETKDAAGGTQQSKQYSTIAGTDPNGLFLFRSDPGDRTGRISDSPVGDQSYWSWSDWSFVRRGVRKLSVTKSATSRPSRCPAVRSKRKCCPAKTRLNVASSAAAEKLVKERSTPGRTSEVTLNSKWSRSKKEVSTSAAAELRTA